jgi:hypothetical protein
MYLPLYTSAHGLVGFRCTTGDCTRVVRTLRGIKSHAWRVHHVKQQMEIVYEQNTKDSTETNGESLRAALDDAGDPLRWKSEEGVPF